MKHSILTVPNVASPANAINVPTPLNFQSPAGAWGHWVLRESDDSLIGLVNDRDLTKIGTPSYLTAGAIVGDGARLDTGFTPLDEFTMFVVGYYDQLTRPYLGNYGGSPSAGYALFSSAASAAIKVNHTGTPTSVPDQGLGATSQWFMALLTVGDGKWKMYVPQSTETNPHSSTYTSPVLTLDASILLGGRQDTVGEAQATILEAGIFDRVVTDAEMPTIYAAAKANAALLGVTLTEPA